MVAALDASRPLGSAGVPASTAAPHTAVVAARTRDPNGRVALLRSTPRQGTADLLVTSTAPATGSAPQAILLYNDACSVCKKISSWVIRSDDPKNGGRQLLDERPIGNDPTALKALNPKLDIWEAYAKIHLLMPDGTIKIGGEAVAEVLRRLPRTHRLARLFDFALFGWRPFQSALNAAYVILDKLRPALGCKACGAPVPWWGKPIEWAVKLWGFLFRKGAAPA